MTTNRSWGTGLEIRPIEPGDRAALAAAVDQSSDEAVYRRFLNPHGRLTAAELRYLTEVDHIAIEIPKKRQIVGTAPSWRSSRSRRPSNNLVPRP